MSTERPALVGERIRVLRLRERLTQTALGARTGIAPSHISMMEAGQRGNVETWVVALLASALGTTMEYLMGLTDDPLPRAETPASSWDEALHQLRLLRPEAQDALAEFLRLVRQQLQDDPDTSEDTPR